MLTRRALLSAALPVSGEPHSGELRFRLIRGGAAIGTHVLQFQPRPGGLSIDIAVDIAVGIGPIVLYRYRLRGREVWENGHCVEASATTDDDGSAQFMRATRRGDRLEVEGSAVSTYRAPANAMVASHWNRNELHGPWINLQNGKLLHPAVTPLGSDPVTMANGTRVPASCYSITGPARIRIWYTPSSVWTGLVFVAKDGSHVTYERMS